VSGYAIGVFMLLEGLFYKHWSARKLSIRDLFIAIYTALHKKSCNPEKPCG